MSQLTDAAVVVLKHVTAAISDMCFGKMSGEQPSFILAAGEATVNGQDRGVILELDMYSGKARVLAIAPDPSLTISNVRIDVARLDSAAVAGTEELARNAPSFEGPAPADSV